MKRRDLLGLACIWLAGLTLPSRAQQPSRGWRIGFLSPSSAAGTEGRLNAFREGLRELGYVEGRNLAIEFRWAEDRYERLPALAGELARLKPHVIVTFAAPGVRAAKDATATIPIVMANVGDAIDVGLIASLARPGGNVTGSTWFSLEMYAKRVELLTQAFPRARRFAFLINPSSLRFKHVLEATEAAAKLLKVELLPFAARGPSELDRAFAEMASARVEALSVQDEPAFLANARAITELAARHKLPSVAGTAYADAGGLLGYGPNFEELFRRAAYFVDRIFKGANPADLPVEGPTRFELVVNAKTAKAIGIAFPQAFLARADRVIE